MVLPLFDRCTVFWDSCGQGSKSYWNKLNHLAACIIEGHAVNGQMNFLPYLADPICKHAVTSLNLSFSISVSPSYMLSEFRLAHQLHYHLTRQCDQLQLPLAKTTKYQGIFRITCNGTYAYNSLSSNIRAIKDSINLSPWRNGISSPRQLSSEILPLSCAYVLLVDYSLFIILLY